MKRKLAQTIDRREIDVSYLCPLGLIWLRDCSNCSFTVGHRKYANQRTAPAASSPFPPEVSALASTSVNEEFLFALTSSTWPTAVYPARLLTLLGVLSSERTSGSCCSRELRCEEVTCAFGEFQKGMSANVVARASQHVSAC